VRRGTAGGRLSTGGGGGEKERPREIGVWARIKIPSRVQPKKEGGKKKKGSAAQLPREAPTGNRKKKGPKGGGGKKKWSRGRTLFKTFPWRVPMPFGGGKSEGRKKERELTAQRHGGSSPWGEKKKKKREGNPLMELLNFPNFRREEGGNDREKKNPAYISAYHCAVKRGRGESGHLQPRCLPLHRDAGKGKALRRKKKKGVLEARTAAERRHPQRKRGKKGERKNRPEGDGPKSPLPPVREPGEERKKKKREGKKNGLHNILSSLRQGGGGGKTKKKKRVAVFSFICGREGKKEEKKKVPRKGGREKRDARRCQLTPTL